MAKIFTVSEINRYTATLIRSDLVLGKYVDVEGEIGDYTAKDGNIYMTIKDEAGCSLKVNFFRSDNRKSALALKVGMKIVCTGKINLYEKLGTYSLTASVVKESGKGQLYEQFLKLKERLEAEGLFEQSKKKAIPEMPLKIGVVTSADGAVIRDIITTVKSRAPQISIILASASVQGAGAAESMITALDLLEEYGGIDTVIIGRGGGSFEDLNCFNDETLVRKISSYRIPIISAVGHETDFTLTDYAADERCPTPTAAAAKAAPDSRALLSILEEKLSFAKSLPAKKMHFLKSILSSKLPVLKALHPLTQLQQRQIMTDSFYEKLNLHIERIFTYSKENLKLAQARLYGRDPRQPLKKGYAYMTDSCGKIIKSVDSLAKGEKISMILSDGKAEGTIDKILKNRAVSASESK